MDIFVSQSPPLTQLTGFPKSVLDRYARVTREEVRSQILPLVRFSGWTATGFETPEAQSRKAMAQVWPDSRQTSLLQTEATSYQAHAAGEDYSAKLCACATCRELFLNVNTVPRKVKPSTFPTTYTVEDLPGVFSDFFQSKIAAICNNHDRFASSPSSAEPGEYSGCPLVEFRNCNAFCDKRSLGKNKLPFFFLFFFSWTASLLLFLLLFVSTPCVAFSCWSW